MKKVHRAMAEDDELHAKLDSRRSIRLSPSLPSHFSDWGADKEGGMPSIEEEEVSGGECSAKEDVPELLQASSSSIGDPELHSLSCLVSDSMPKPAVEVEEGPLAFPFPEALEEGKPLTRYRCLLPGARRWSPCSTRLTVMVRSWERSWTACLAK
ncbi:hypothetical protein Dimus_031556, partial [Dionaea muscipula]